MAQSDILTKKRKSKNIKNASLSVILITGPPFYHLSPQVCLGSTVKDNKAMSQWWESKVRTIRQRMYDSLTTQRPGEKERESWNWLLCKYSIKFAQKGITKLNKSNLSLSPYPFVYLPYISLSLPSLCPSRMCRTVIYQNRGTPVCWLGSLKVIVIMSL